MQTIDIELEKMISKGIKNEKIFKSEVTDARIKYRGISTLASRESLSVFFNDLEIFSDEEMTEITGNDRSEEELELEEQKPIEERETMEERANRMNISVADYRKAVLLYNINIVYQGIRSFYPYLQEMTHEEGIEFIAFFDEKDINILSELILAISGASEENKQKVKKFPAQYAKPSKDKKSS